MLYSASLSYYVCWTDVRSNPFETRDAMSLTWPGDPPGDNDRLNYTWINQDRKSVNLAAPTYIDYVMTWIQNLLNDEATFPTKAG